MREVAKPKTPLGRDIGERNSASKKMALAIACGGSSSSLLFSAQVYLFRFVEKTLDSIKLNVTRILYPKLYTDPNFRFCLHNELEEFGANLGATAESWLGMESWFSKHGNLGDQRDPQAVYSALDGLLKGSLNRLKSMRESISLDRISDTACFSGASYDEHVDMLIQLCKERKLGAALWLRKKMVQKGAVPDLVSHNFLINELCRSGELERVDVLFTEMSELGPPPNSVTYNNYIKGYCTIDNVEMALRLFSTMVNSGVQPNRITCNILIHALCKRGLMTDARKHLEQMIDKVKDSVSSELVTNTTLMDGYFKNGELVQALLIWDRMSEKNQKDLVAYNVLVHGLCLNGHMKHAYATVCEMLKTGFPPDVYTYNIIISQLCRGGDFDEAFYTYNVMSKRGVSPDYISYKMIIQGLCIHGEVVKAAEFFRHIPKNSLVADPLIWNCLIDGYGGRCQSGDLSEALMIGNQMVASGVNPNVYTYNAVLKAQLKGNRLRDALCLKQEMKQKGILPDLITYNLLIDAACKCGCISYALELHDEMLERGCEPDLVTYTELISGYCAKGYVSKAEQLLAEIESSSIPVDDVPYKILIKKYISLGCTDMALNIIHKRKVEM